MRTVSTVAFIGLGVMGGPMAGHLARQGLTLRVYNRTRAKADAWVNEYGGSAHASPKDAAAGADLVLSCVGKAPFWWITPPPRQIWRKSSPEPANYTASAFSTLLSPAGNKALSTAR